MSAYLEHYGVKGMKWGVRRERKPRNPEPVKIVEKPGMRMRADGGRNLRAHSDAKNALASRTKARRSGLDSLSTKELGDLVKRMQLEQQYNSISSQRNVSTVKRGERILKRGIELGRTANEAYAMVNSPVVKKLAGLMAAG